MADTNYNNSNVNTDINSLLTALNYASSNNPSEIKQAEVFLEKRKEHSNYLSQLLTIISNNDSNESVKLTAAIQLKNYNHNYWRFSNDNNYNKSLVFSEDELIIIISNDEKELYKKEILNIIGNCVNKRLLEVLVASTNKPLKFNLSTWGESYITQILNLLNSNNENKIYASLTAFYEAAKINQHESINNKTVYYRALNVIFDKLTLFAQDLCEKLDNSLALTILNKVLEIYYASVQSNIPNYIIKTNVFETWLKILLTIVKNINGPLKDNNMSIDVSNCYWKTVCLAVETVYKIFIRYSQVSDNDDVQLKEFSLNLNQKYSEDILYVFLVVLEKSKTQIIYNKVLCFVYKYFAKLIQNDLHIKFFEDRINLLTSEFIIKDSYITKDDIRERQEDMKEYVYKKFDISALFYEKKYACNQFFKQLCEYRRYNASIKKLDKPLFFQNIFKYLISLLIECDNEYKNEGKSNTYILKKEAIMCLLESISNVVVVNCLHSDIEIILEKYILNEIIPDNNDNNNNNNNNNNNSNNSMYLMLIKERSCSVLKAFSKIQFSNLNLVKKIIECLCELLKESDLSLKINSCLTIPCFLNDKNVLTHFNKYTKNFLEIYLSLVNEIDLEEIFVSLEQLIDKLGDSILEYSVQLTKELVKQYHRLININVDEDGGDAMCAADGVLTAIQTIIKISSKAPSILSEVEEIISPMMSYGLSKEGFESLETTIDTIRILLESSNEISNQSWSYFTPINFSIIGDEDDNKTILEAYKDCCLEGLGYDSLSCLTSLLHLYIQKDPVTLLTKTDNKNCMYVNRLFQTLNQIIINSKINNDTDGLLNATKCYISFVDSITYHNSINENSKLNIDVYVEGILSSAVSILNTNNTKKIKAFTIVKCLQVVLLLSLIHYNKDLILKLLYKSQSIINILECSFNLISHITYNDHINKCLIGLVDILLIMPNYETYGLKNENIWNSLMNNIVLTASKVIVFKQNNSDKNNNDNNNNNIDESEDALEAHLQKVS